MNPHGHGKCCEARVRFAFVLVAVALVACGDDGPRGAPLNDFCNTTGKCGAFHDERDVVHPPPASIAQPPCTEGLTDVCEVAHALEPYSGRTTAHPEVNPQAQRIVVDDSSLYWLTGAEDSTPPSFRVRQVSKRSSSAAVIDERGRGIVYFPDIAVGGGFLFWSDDAGVKRAPITGGAGTAFFPANTVAALAADETYVYAYADKTFSAIPLAGGNRVSLVPYDNCVRPVSNGTHIFCSTYGFARRYPKDGSPQNDVATGVGDVIAVSESTLYAMNDATKQLIAAPVEGGDVTVLTTNPAEYSEMFFVGGSIYGLLSSGDVERVQLDGTRTTLSTGTLPRHFTVDATGIYWVAARSYCLLEHVHQISGSSSFLDESTCTDGRDETVVYRAALNF